LSIVFLLPGIISLYYINRKRLDLAFLNVYLPCALALPDYFSCRLPHLPPISAADAALIPLGIAIFSRSASKWRISRMDIWVALYVLSFILSEVTRERITKDGMLIAVSGITGMALPYIVGRRLIEPELRLPTLKRWVFLMLMLLPLGLFEFRMGQSLFVMMAGRVLGLDTPWSVQMRNGHVRVAMSFSDAELAGIAFAMAFFLNSSLHSISLADLRSGALPRLGAFWQRLEKSRLPGALLLMTLLATESRGPIAATIFGLVILQIPKFRNVRLAAILALLLSLGGLLGAYSYFQHSTSLQSTGDVSEEQASANYRRALLENYKPVLEEGGWLGWGVLSYPVFPGQKSIDNDFLLVQITQGRLGLALWLLICAESLWRLMTCAWKFKNREDLSFAIALLAALITMWITIATVFLGGQVAAISFLLFGWSQSLRDGANLQQRQSFGESLSNFKFKRTFQ